MAKIGRADVPVGLDYDKLDIKKYAAALAGYVLECETPMTVGIQGEWGSGKTSLMRMMRDHIRQSSANSQNNNKVPNPKDGPPWMYDFETWQYGAVGDDSDLGLSLLLNLTAEIMAQHQDDGLIARTGAAISRIANVVRRAGKAFAAGAISAVTSEMIDGGTLVSSDGTPAPRGVELMQLKAQFSKLVKQVVESAPKPPNDRARFILFVDDLDRVRPDRAVSMLEVLKNFMDVPGVVFVIACDYEVVREGVRLRFGIHDEEKARAFFDKIIQVPFHMPVTSYEVNGLLQDYLQNRISSSKENQGASVFHAGRVSPMVRIATGRNPRAFKRYLNAVDLHARLGTAGATSNAKLDESTAKLEIWNHAASLYSLLALVALQLRWPRTAAYLTASQDSKTISATLDMLRHGLTEEDLQEADKELKSALRSDIAKGIDDVGLCQHPSMSDLATFCDHLWNLLEPHENELTEKGLAAFMKLGKQLSLTEVGANDTVVSGWYDFVDALNQRQKNKEVWAKPVLDLATKLFDDRGEHRHLVVIRQAERVNVTVSLNGKMPGLFSLGASGEVRHNLTEFTRDRNEDEAIQRVYTDSIAFLRELSQERSVVWQPIRKTTEFISLVSLEKDQVLRVLDVVARVIQFVSSKLDEEARRTRSRSIVEEVPAPTTE